MLRASFRQWTTYAPVCRQFNKVNSYFDTSDCMHTGVLAHQDCYQLHSGDRLHTHHCDDTLTLLPAPLMHWTLHADQYIETPRLWPFTFTHWTACSPQLWPLKGITSYVDEIDCMHTSLLAQQDYHQLHLCIKRIRPGMLTRPGGCALTHGNGLHRHRMLAFEDCYQLL